jgi:hypothetical protein
VAELLGPDYKTHGDGAGPRFFSLSRTEKMAGVAGLGHSDTHSPQSRSHAGSAGGRVPLQKGPRNGHARRQRAATRRRGVASEIEPLSFFRASARLTDFGEAPAEHPLKEGRNAMTRFGAGTVASLDLGARGLAQPIRDLVSSEPCTVRC